MFDPKIIKQDFEILSREVKGKPLTYLDNAATTQKPRSVVEAIVKFYYQHNANVHRGIHTLGDEATRLYEEARTKVAGFIGADKDELIFVRNTTEAINVVAGGWASQQLRPGDEILTTVMEHHSNLVPWFQLARNQGIKVRLAQVTDDGLLDREDLARKLSGRTKLIAVTQVSNVLGTINPIEAIVKLAKREGAKVLVDAAQSVQHIGVDVKQLGCDFLAFSGHKMMGPMGIGCLFVKRARQAEMEPWLTGGGMIDRVWETGATWIEGVEKFEAGTPNVAGAVGLAAAIDYQQKLTLAAIRQHERELTDYVLERLTAAKADLKIRLLGPGEAEQRGGMVAFTMAGVHAHDVAQVLDSEGVAVRSGHHCAMPLHQRLKLRASTRASFYVYNTKEDIDRLLTGLVKVKQVFTA